jgi:hypothetical protein
MAPAKSGCDRALLDGAMFAHSAQYCNEGPLIFEVFRRFAQ